jgi:peptidoglycan/xylan/chitin deacetylase (PgdA/CDA1 family)
MSKSGVVFLMYHELSVPGRQLCYNEPGYTRYVTSSSDFDAQMRQLAAVLWRGGAVGQFLASREKNSVVITFDDGCETDLIRAAPVLKELGFGATFYITAGFVGKTGYLSNAQVRELVTQGFEIGCHSMTHPYLTDLLPGPLREETAAAKERLEQMTGAPVIHYSCPGGRWNASVVAAVREAGFASMATSRTGMNFPSTDPFALRRVPILQHTPLAQFTRIWRGQGLRWMRLQEKARESAKLALGNSAYDALRSLLLGGKNRA